MSDMFFALSSEIRNRVTSFILDLDCVRSGIDLPRESGLYFVYDEIRQIVVYVGKANDLRQRWRNHHMQCLIDSGNHRIHYKTGHDWRSHLLTEEAFFIVCLLPENNKQVKVNIAAIGQYIDAT